MAQFLLKNRSVRRFWHFLERLWPFLLVTFSADGLGSESGRLLIWGKFRRAWLSLFPTYAKKLQQEYGLTGGCTHCASSCKLLFQCPHWDDQTSRCSVYEDRPDICRLFPITPADIRDRNLVSLNTECGFVFAKQGAKKHPVEEEKNTSPALLPK